MPHNAKTKVLACLALSIAVGAICGRRSFVVLDRQAARTYFRVSMSATTTSVTQLFYDLGQGMTEKTAVTTPIRESTAFSDFSFRLPPQGIHLLRLDPITAPGRIRIKHARIEDGRGRVLRRFAPGDLLPDTDIAAAVVEGDVLALETTPDATDPSVLLHFDTPWSPDLRSAGRENGQASHRVVFLAGTATLLALLGLSSLRRAAPGIRAGAHRLAHGFLDWAAARVVWIKGGPHERRQAVIAAIDLLVFLVPLTVFLLARAQCTSETALYETVHGGRLRNELGFDARVVLVRFGDRFSRELVLLNLIRNGAMERAGFRNGDIVPGQSAALFYRQLEEARGRTVGLAVLDGNDGPPKDERTLNRLLLSVPAAEPK